MEDLGLYTHCRFAADTSSHWWCHLVVDLVYCGGGGQHILYFWLCTYAYCSNMEDNKTYFIWGLCTHTLYVYCSKWETTKHYLGLWRDTLLYSTTDITCWWCHLVVDQPFFIMGSGQQNIYFRLCTHTQYAYCSNLGDNKTYIMWAYAHMSLLH